MKTRNLTKKGFTLIELMIVITVIAILAAIVLFGLGAAQRNARDVQRAQIMRGVQTALQAQASTNGSGAYLSNAAAAPGLNCTNGTGCWGPMTTALTSFIGTGGLVDPGCGSGTQDMVGVVGGEPPTSTGCAAGSVQYMYFYGANPAISGVSTCPNVTGKYVLVLKKEGGGYQTFCAPQ